MTYDLYSPLLVFAAINLIIAAVSLAAGHFKPGHSPPWVPWLAAAMVLVGVVLALTSHLLLGHRSGTAAAMAGTDFVAAHPAPFIFGVLGLGLLLLCRRSDAA